MNLLMKEYPITDGIINALPPELNYSEPNVQAKTWWQVHEEVFPQYKTKDLLSDKNAMAQVQKDFYDKMAVGFQAMDDIDKKTGGVMLWRINRVAKYDEQFFKKNKLLFIGAGNCRNAIRYAKMGYDVTATDISINMLKIGRERAEAQGIKMTYVAHNGEQPFPFNSNQFDTVYSLCVANHVTDWENYFSEKLRCLKPGGILLERMPNSKMWGFWKDMKDLNDCMEIKAKKCNVESANEILKKITPNFSEAKVWTHDRQIPMDLLRKLPRRFRLKAAKFLYDIRTKKEDKKFHPKNINRLDNRLNIVNDDEHGIYTVIHVVK